MNMNETQFYKSIEQIVLNVMKDKGMLIGQWHLGEVDSVISPTKLKVFVDADSTSQTVSCNPDITFTTGDHVWVIFINGNPRDKFVISRRIVS
jgi:hypothetical protein